MTAERKIMTVAQVADELQVKPQTIRNWIEGGALPAAKIGRAYHIKREDVDALLARAQADSASLATRRDLWSPQTVGLPRRDREAKHPNSVWDDKGAQAVPSKRS